MNDTKYALTGHYELRHIAGEDVLMPVNGFLEDSNHLPKIINEVPAFIIRKLERSPAAFDQILDSILSEYNIDKAHAQSEVNDILELLIKQQVVQTQNPA